LLFVPHHRWYHYFLCFFYIFKRFLISKFECVNMSSSQSRPSRQTNWSNWKWERLVLKGRDSREVWSFRVARVCSFNSRRCSQSVYKQFNWDSCGF
jgi:hypothetical protein